MSSIRQPVGPQPPSVYWRRRLVVLLGLIAVVVIIVLIIVRPGSGDGGAKTPSPTPSISNTPAFSGEGDACDPSVIAIEPVTDADSYDPGQQPLISMSITNRGATACTFDVGTAAQEYVIVSGTDPIWDSRTCQTNPTSLEQVLEPNQTLSTTPFSWDRTRSSADTCTSSRPEVVGGGATYRLSVKLGGVTSASDKPFLLF